MAKFSGKNIEFKDNQRAIFGDGDDSAIYWDGDQLTITTVVSGVDPTEEGHLVTKRYIDEELATISGGIVQDHGSLTGLGDDDHTQYHNDGRANTWFNTKSIDDLSDVSAGSPLDNQVLTWSGTQWVPTSQVSFTGGSMGEWTYKGVSSDADPGTSNFKVNNSDELLVTELYVSNTNRAGVDLGNFLGEFQADDYIYMQKTNTASQAYLYKVVSVVDNTSYHTYTVTFSDSSGVDISNNDKVTFVKLLRQINVVTDHGALTGLGDDDHTQYLRTDGTRALTDTWEYGSASISGTGSFYGVGSTLDEIAYVDGDDVYFYDDTRSKDLGVAVIEVGAARDSVSTTDQYLRTYDGVPMNKSGSALPWDATLIGISMSGEENNQTWTVQVRKNDSATSLASLTITNAYENHSWDEDVDFSAGDRIQLYLSGASIDYPQAKAYFRRRK